MHSFNILAQQKPNKYSFVEMKPQHLSGDSSSKRTMGEKLRQAWAAAMVAMAGSGTMKGGGISISKAIERRNRRSGVEDPLRTMMFLGSWSHT